MTISNRASSWFKAIGYGFAATALIVFYIRFLSADTIIAPTADRSDIIPKTIFGIETALLVIFVSFVGCFLSWTIALLLRSKRLAQ